jgi:hypothetical protein
MVEAAAPNAEQGKGVTAIKCVYDSITHKDYKRADAAAHLARPA